MTIHAVYEDLHISGTDLHISGAHLHISGMIFRLILQDFWLYGLPRALYTPCNIYAWQGECKKISNVLFQVETREDEEQNVKLNQTIELLLAAGYFRARIKGLSPFDKVFLQKPSRMYSKCCSPILFMHGFADINNSIPTFWDLAMQQCRLTHSIMIRPCVSLEECTLLFRSSSSGF